MRITLITLALVLTARLAIGQQNFFNVPSSDITPKGKIFFQQQFNFFNEGLQANSTCDYGLGKGAEIGLNYLGLSILDLNRKVVEIPLDDTLAPYNPFLMLNAQKKFVLGEHLGLGVGGQLGMTTTSQIRRGSYLYSNLTWSRESLGLKTVAGCYFASNSFFGPGSRGLNRLGFQAGLEQSVVRDRLVFQADFISGQHNLGELVLGTACYVNRNWIVSAGYQIPTFGSRSTRAVVFELTYNPQSG